MFACRAYATSQVLCNIPPLARSIHVKLFVVHYPYTPHSTRVEASPCCWLELTKKTARLIAWSCMYHTDGHPLHTLLIRPDSSQEDKTLVGIEWFEEDMAGSCFVIFISFFE